MLNRRLFFTVAVSILLVFLYSGVNAQICTDRDGDGYGNPGNASCPKGNKLDCDDNDNKVYPGAAEICDGKDTNCDGYKPATDVDKDGDGVPQCKNDCNDGNNKIYPGAPELCDGLDNNCDYSIPVNERDADSDGYRTCGVPADCNDNDRYINPGAQEWCSDTKDNNCNSQTDETPCICPDADSDGYTASYCGGTDCDDINVTVYPGAPELCTDGKDNDCNGLKDCADPNAVNCPAITDADRDGYDVAGICGTPDCDDSDPKVHPGAAEICDGKDSNCDGWKAPSDVDADSDGVAVCAGDCNDNNANINPLILERHIGDPICGDSLDNDCDGRTDAADSGCSAGSCNTKTSPKDAPHFFTLLNPDNTVHGQNTTLNCGKCHAPDFNDPIRFACQRCHTDPADTTDPLNGTLKAQYPLAPPYGYGTAPNVAMHASSVVGLKYGSWTMGDKGCVTCHNPHAQEQNNIFGTDYGMFIKEYICYDNNVTGHSVQEFVELTYPTGAGSFADGPPNNENVCEMCHTRTNHHQRDGSAPGGQAHLDGQQCTYCHVHKDGFLPTASKATNPHNTEFFNANCQFCHVETNGVVDYRTRIPDAYCQRCHGERKSHTSDINRNSLASGRYTYDIMCVDCHNPMLPVDNNRKLLKPYINFTRTLDGSNVGDVNIINTSRRGTGSLADGPPNDQNVCDTCHSRTSHNRFDGTGGGVHADSANRTGSYCMICHDHNKAFMSPGKTCLEENEPGINCGP